MEKFKDSKYIFLVGIGGSNLATKAVWNALTLHRPDIHKKIFFLESPDSREYEEVENFVKTQVAAPEETAIIAISKSGKTAETLETLHKTFEILSEKFGSPINGRVLIISTPDSDLWRLAESKNFERLEWQSGVGGRFSAFTVAHVAPLSIAGIDISKFKEGSASWSEGSGAAELARKIFNSYKEGKDILDFFIFNSELEDLGKWCRQLIAESLGKENKKGQRAGLTPTVSIGPADLHSMLQLNLGGPKNKFTIFIKSRKEIAGGLAEAAFEDAVSAYSREGLPSHRYEMPEISGFELGRFMQFMIDLTLELAKLLEVNPYDQPEVEEYKEHMTNS